MDVIWAGIKEYGVFAVIAGVLLGAGAALIAALRAYQKKPARSLEQLLDTQAVVSRLTVAECAVWFKREAAGRDGELSGLLVRPTAANMKRFNFEWDSRMDVEHYLLQLLFDMKNSRIVAYRLINFKEMDEALNSMIEEDGTSKLITMED